MKSGKHPPGQQKLANISQFFYPHFWIHALLRWNRSTRQTNGGGYAFTAGYYRKLLKPNANKYELFFPLEPRTSSSPYTGWLSDESVLNAITDNEDLLVDYGNVVNHNPIYGDLFNLALFWDQHVPR